MSGSKEWAGVVLIRVFKVSKAAWGASVQEGVYEM